MTAARDCSKLPSLERARRSRRWSRCRYGSGHRPGRAERQSARGQRMTIRAAQALVPIPGDPLISPVSHSYVAARGSDPEVRDRSCR